MLLCALFFVAAANASIVVAGAVRLSLSEGYSGRVSQDKGVVSAGTR